MAFPEGYDPGPTDGDYATSLDRDVAGIVVLTVFTFTGFVPFGATLSDPSGIDAGANFPLLDPADPTSAAVDYEGPIDQLLEGLGAAVIAGVGTGIVGLTSGAALEALEADFTNANAFGLTPEEESDLEDMSTYTATGAIAGGAALLGQYLPKDLE